MNTFQELMNSCHYEYYKGYTIFETGDIYGKNGKKLKHNLVTNRNGRIYPKYHLYTVDGASRGKEIWFAHRLMAWVFMAKDHFTMDEFKTMIVDHIDNDPMNYALYNIEILSSSQNLTRRHQEFSAVPF